MNLSRRRFIAATGGAVAATVFDPVRRVFIGEAVAADCGAKAIRIPHLDGTLSVDPVDLAMASEDFGRIISRSPRAVLRPGSADDIARVIRFARKHRIKVAMRGISHSVFGQAMVDCGIVIDSSGLSTIHSIDERSAKVDVGVKWSDLLNATLAHGLAPKVLTDYIQLTVGGVLSVGGIGGVSHRHGFVCDNVSRIEAVDGWGRKSVCSPRRQRGLFDAVRGGLGQFAVMTKAWIDLEPAPAFARIYDLVYTDLASYLADQRKVAADERFNFLEGQIISDGAGGWNYLLQAGAWYTPPAAPSDGALTADLSFVDSTTTDLPYAAWLARVDVVEQALRGLGIWDLPKPWSDLFLSDRQVETYVADVVSRLAPDDLGLGLVLLYPIKRAATNAPSIATPRGSLFWAFDILRIPPTGDPAIIDDLVRRNRALYDDARAKGGRRYAIGALEFSQQDWRRHYARKWWRIVANKFRFDPRNVLTPGQGIFE